MLQLITGFALIRWLTKDDYATLTLVMAIQGTAAVLVELGISQSLTALIGRKVGDAKVVGRYIAACRFYRDRLLILGGVILFVVFSAIAPRYGWTHGLWFWLWLSVILALVFQAWGAIYGPIFLLEQNLKTMYKINVSASVLRFVLIVGTYLLGFLTAPVVLMYGAVQACVSGWSSMRLTKSKVATPVAGEGLEAEKSEIRSLSLPRVPSSIFYAFQGQITVFLISIFGTTAGLAEIGALSRLAMLFVIFKRAGNMLIVPYFSKMNSEDVLFKTVLFSAGAMVFFCIISVLAYLFPQPFLLILGDGYQHLSYEIFIILTSSALSLMSTVVFSICVARKYIYSWFSIVEVVPLIIVMAVGFSLIDLSNLTNVLYLGFAMAFTRLLAKTFILVVGLSREKRTKLC